MGWKITSLVVEGDGPKKHQHFSMGLNHMSCGCGVAVSTAGLFWDIKGALADAVGVSLFCIDCQ